jgi:hypothetical protein
MKRVVKVARKSGLSKMTAKQIDTEIKEYRKNAKAGN